MAPELPPGRKRRAHKRSRNGCLTCKQRHIRCDEVKPICTNCLTRGGECGYPEPGGPLTPGSASGSAPAGVSKGDLAGQRLTPIASSPVDPFDCLPIKMPHRSLELFHHYAHYRIFNRTPVPKNPDSDCVGIALSAPGTFRACLLLTALNYTWLAGSGSLQTTDMEETFLYHKLEAMRLVNEQIYDPIQSTSDGCLSMIAALAMVESGMGDHIAAEAHLNGLFTLIDMKRPEEWQHRFYGLLQRIILATGSYIAAAKSLDSGSMTQLRAEIELGVHDHQPLAIRAPSPLFSTAPMVATRLSPFYLGSLPCLEACKADVEGLVLTNTLRRLSALPVIDPPVATAASSRSSSFQPAGVGSPERGSRHASPETEARSADTYRLPPQAAHQLLSDTDAFIASLLFKPHPLLRPHSQPRHRSASRSLSPAVPQPTSSTAARPTEEKTSETTFYTDRIRTDPFSQLPADLFPSPGRAWATAAYLYLHVLLAPLWGDVSSAPFLADLSSAGISGKRKCSPDGALVDPHLLRVLLDTLCVDIEQTEGAMRIGAYSRELWLWKVVVGAYTVEVMGIGIQGGEGGFGPVQRKGKGKGKAVDQKVFFGWVLEDDGDDDGERADYEGEGMAEETGEEEAGQERTAAGLGAWFGERMRVWTLVTQITDWESARQRLGRIVWPEATEQRLGNAASVIEGLWWRAIGDGGGRANLGMRKLPVIAIDPRLS
ncbi:hypothetical protein QBC47DRAFT_430019 [Echria macrotheca]|uniref:Zn(2)-C6 fungal-type domain-containing protein n=1 Tax=Echria macrotheca TaxID=438768 RepID=A0AAJ0B7Z1_9PEZI|nr:hypothetical protein QBC47DRAFT_430019 [Echria macrotheca]